jgi:two-component system, NtrC family, response regulator AtoC
MSKPDTTSALEEMNTAQAFEQEAQPTPNTAHLLGYIDGKSQLFELAVGESMTIGRSREATFPIPDAKVSRLHAKILFDERGTLWIEDLDSKNGVERNGKKITGQTALVSGDEIKIPPGMLVVGAIPKISSKLKEEVHSYAFFEERLSSELDRAARYRRALALLMVRLGGDGARDTIVREALHRQMRPMDLLSIYGPRELSVLLPEADVTQALAAAKRLVATASAVGGRVFVGISNYPRDGTSAETLISQARAALKSARPEDGIGCSPSTPEEKRGPIIASASMAKVIELVEKVAPTHLSVLLQGETGVGKDIIATELHQRSPRAKGPFVRVNCAAIPETLLESELFGHEKGSFTGAIAQRKGLFETAHGGTIFLDEIGEMSTATQAKLLRVLEGRCIVRVGGVEEISVDARVITATHRNLEAMVSLGSFRQDLMFRLNTFTIQIPSLRERRDDILLMAEIFLKEFSQGRAASPRTISPEAACLLMAHEWSGNVRELKNVMERASVLIEGSVLLPEHLPEKLAKLAEALSALLTPPAQGLVLHNEVAQVERETLVRALESCGGNRTHAAERLGISRRALLYKIDKYNLKDIGKP